MFVSSTLSVSQKNELSCGKMALFLSNAGIITSVTSNISTQPHIEYGCRLTQSIESKEDIRKIWTIIEKKYDFKCGHLKVDGSYDGCILNYLRPSLCSNAKD
jgi:hypothetical protein